MAEERLASPLGKQRMVERKICVEGVFGLAKELHGLRRTRFRGRWRVQIQLWLTAAAMNIKRAVRTIGHTGWPTATARLLAQFFALAMPSSRGQLYQVSPGLEQQSQTMVCICCVHRPMSTR